MRWPWSKAVEIEANPVVINPTPKERVLQRKHRLASIENYLAQRAAEGRPVQAEKKKHLEAEAQLIRAELQAAGECN